LRADLDASGSVEWLVVGCLTLATIVFAALARRELRAARAAAAEPM
jgi:hypothetical protein